MPKQAHEFDIVVYGATGYTGRLVAEYLAEYHDNDGTGPNWAMAGRNRSKLEDVRDLIGAPDDTPLIVADASDPASLTDMAKRAKVILSTVGPYQLYGSELVETCAREGTDYADLCGEPGWMRQMIDQNEDLAKASGARICFSAGFDSVPFDLGVFMLQQEAMKRFGKPAPRVKGRVRAMQGTFSGGTAASLAETIKSVVKNPELIPILQSPFGLTPGFEGPSQPSGLIPEYDKELGKWAAPFIMAAINTKNVHRTNFLLDHPYGEDFKYDEMILTSAGEMGEKAAKAATALLKSPFGTKPPKPGEGPTSEERANGFYDILFVGEMPDGQTIHYGVKGKYDPGYGSTSRMLAETGIALFHSDAEPGIGTPGSFLGEDLVERLREHAELTFEVES